MAQNIYRDSSAQRVGYYLKRELKRRRLTQEEFAAQIGVADRTLRRWIHGDNISLDTVDYIASVLEVSVRDIFSKEDDVPFHFIACKM